MDDRSVNVFLPMRAGSERICNKNTRVFAGLEGGLCKIKIRQLLLCNSVKMIFVSTDDPEVFEICNKVNSKKLKMLRRPNELAASYASTDDLIKYVPDIMPEGHILWTHVTSPFIRSDIYDEMISTYFDKLDKYDSLMTVTKLQKFIWKNGKPVNYDRNIEKWPRTQTLDPLWEVNSGAFIASQKIYKDKLDRIGTKPYLFKLNNEVAFDIDWMQDFILAETIYAKTLVKNTQENKV